MINSIVENPTKERLAGDLCTDLNPERVKGIFICYYIMSGKSDSKKTELEHFSKRIPELGLEKVFDIYKGIEEQLQVNVAKDYKEMAGALKNAMQYFKENVIDKMSSSNFYKTN